MCQNKQVPMTLAIDDTLMVMSVIGFSGRDALNEPYCFEIDLISANPLLDFNELLQRTAYLSLGNQGEGIHGRICSVSQRYAGTDLSHYRVSVMPALQRLGQRNQQRIFHDMSVPQLIVQLLAEHGLDDDAYRFEHTTGLYPPRATCVQHNESDLHLLQRLCEEEGIHFRFEHSRRQHLLIFSDDPASFPERMQPLHFQSHASDLPAHIGLSHLNERLWALPACNSSRARRDEAADRTSSTPTEWVANQPYGHMPDNPPDPHQLRQRQLSARALERLRCERYRVEGRSDQAIPVSGHILQVLNHPQTRYNDQWLLTEVTHRGWHPEILEGFDRYDSARILDSAKPGADPPGYANCFTAIPWAMPFRPSMKRPKPQIHGYLPATLVANAEGLLAIDALGRLPIRFDWQAQPAATDSGCIMAHVGDSELLRANAGATVWVSHFDNDAERPLICALRDASDSLSTVVERLTTVQVDGLRIDLTHAHVHLKRGQRLQVEAQSLLLKGHGVSVELNADSIALTGVEPE